MLLPSTYCWEQGFTAMYLIETKMNNQDGHLKTIHVYVYLKWFPELIYLLESAKLLHRIEMLVINSSLSPIRWSRDSQTELYLFPGVREKTQELHNQISRALETSPFNYD